ncbi:MAG TPA: hypothetical protein VD969_11250 [Symbiobacteriaceae bacterium]|nr:hypothetical protein [Symbiobacteriaceae bacterium]
MGGGAGCTGRIVGGAGAAPMGWFIGGMGAGGMGAGRGGMAFGAGGMPIGGAGGMPIGGAGGIPIGCPGMGGLMFGGAGGTGAWPAAARGLPHSVQKRLPGATAAPQFGQLLTQVLSLTRIHLCVPKFDLRLNIPAGECFLVSVECADEKERAVDRSTAPILWHVSPP